MLFHKLDKIMFREIKWLAQGSSIAKIKLIFQLQKLIFFIMSYFLQYLCNLKILLETKLVELSLVPECETDLNQNWGPHLTFRWSCDIWSGLVWHLRVEFGSGVTWRFGSPS